MFLENENDWVGFEFGLLEKYSKDKQYKFIIEHTGNSAFLVIRKHVNNYYYMLDTKTFNTITQAKEFCDNYVS